MKLSVWASDLRRDSISSRRASSPPHSLSRRAVRSFGSRSTAASNSSLVRAQRSPAGRIVLLSRDFPPEPRFRYAPFSFHCPRRDIQHFGDLFVGQTAEEAQFDDLALAWIEREKIFQRIVER